MSERDAERSVSQTVRAQLALRDMILWLEELTGLTKREAYYLVGLAGHARPGQVQVPLYSMRCLMPKTFIPSRKS